jgi:hypothetical protein
MLTTNYPFSIIKGKVKNNIAKGGRKMNKKHSREYRNACRQKFANYMKSEWGNFSQSGELLLEFDNGKKVVAPFSDLQNYNKWWFGVSKLYWKNWDTNTYISLLMNEGNICRFCLLNPRKSKKLLDEINPVSGEKKIINVLIPASGGFTYIQEWPTFNIDQNTISLGRIDDDSIEKIQGEKNLSAAEKLDILKKHLIRRSQE